jgi:hypothetical protein
MQANSNNLSELNKRLKNILQKIDIRIDAKMLNKVLNRSFQK